MMLTFLGLLLQLDNDSFQKRMDATQNVIAMARNAPLECIQCAKVLRNQKGTSLEMQTRIDICARGIWLKYIYPHTEFYLKACAMRCFHYAWDYNSQTYLITHITPFSDLDGKLKVGDEYDESSDVIYGKECWVQVFRNGISMRIAYKPLLKTYWEYANEVNDEEEKMYAEFLHTLEREGE